MSDSLKTTTYIHTSPASSERLALSLEHVDHDDLVDVDARARVELGHVRVRTCMHTYIHSPDLPGRLAHVNHDGCASRACGLGTFVSRAPCNVVRVRM